MEVGYQFTSYINALQEGTGVLQQDIQGNPNPNTGSVFTNTFEGFDDNYFNSGLFLNLNLSYR